jgi:hypothetical protein
MQRDAALESGLFGGTQLWHSLDERQRRLNSKYCTSGVDKAVGDHHFATGIGHRQIRKGAAQNVRRSSGIRTPNKRSSSSMSFADDGASGDVCTSRPFTACSTARLAVQMPIAEKQRRAQYVIENDADLATLAVRSSSVFSTVLARPIALGV